MHTPFFPALRPRLAACRTSATQQIRQASLAQLEHFLQGIFPPHCLAQEDGGQNSRDRIYTLSLTLQCFLWQLLKPRTSCREAVRQVQALFRTLKGGLIDEGTSGYCQARERLPRERIERLIEVAAQTAERRAGPGGSLNGRPVKVVDCSSAKAPDTAANQERYPQPSEQKPGCGFPVIRFLLLFSLNSGSVLKVIMSSLQKHEVRLLRQLQQDISRGDILLGDRAYGDYTTLASWPARGVDVVARVNAMRKVDFRKARRLANNDGLFEWKRSDTASKVLSPEEWRSLPEQITIRIIRFTATIRGYRARRITLVTSLLDAKLYPAQQLIGLYARRWRLELCLRDLKTTLGLEMLRCQTPDMAEKELLIYVLAHNLIRCLMAEAVSRYQADLQRVSFKGSVDALRQYSAVIASARNRKLRDRLWEDLLINLARDLVPLRPNREEPRALKLRPKPFGWLTKPRHRFRVSPHRNRYWRSKLRNYRSLN
jgi:hypothetical protein